MGLGAKNCEHRSPIISSGAPDGRFPTCKKAVYQGDKLGGPCGAMRVGPYTFFYTVLHMWSIVVLAALFRNELRDDNKNSGMPFSSHLHFSYELSPL